MVDDGSTDNTEGVVSHFVKTDPRVRYYYQENKRQASARNNGLSRCYGAFVQFLDADDLLEPQKFEQQLSFLQRNGDADIVYGGVHYFDTDSPKEFHYRLSGADEPWMPKTSGRGEKMVSDLLENNILVINAALIRRRVFETVGSFDEQLPPVEDWDFFLRCAIAGISFAYAEMGADFALVRRHEDSSSNNIYSRMASELLTRKKTSKILGEPRLRRINSEKIALLLSCLATHDVMEGRRRNGMEGFFKASLASCSMRWRVRHMLYIPLLLFVARKSFAKISSFNVSRTLGSK